MTVDLAVPDHSILRCRARMARISLPKAVARRDGDGPDENNILAGRLRPEGRTADDRGRYLLPGAELHDPPGHAPDSSGDEGQMGPGGITAQLSPCNRTFRPTGSTRIPDVPNTDSARLYWSGEG